MRDRFWAMYSETQFTYFYYWQYRDLSQKIDFWLRVVSTFTTGGSVAAILLKKINTHNLDNPYCNFPNLPVSPTPSSISRKNDSN